MKRSIVSPEMPRRTQYSDYFIAASLPYGDLEVPDLHSDEMRQWRTVTPPPHEHVFLDKSAILSKEPFDLDETSSVSSQGSVYTRAGRASAMLTEPRYFSSQKHPWVDCAFNIYTSALQRACYHFDPTEDDTPKNWDMWHKVCAMVRPDFFMYRQDPPLAKNLSESARFTSWLIDAAFLREVTGRANAGAGIAMQLLTAADISAKARADNFSHSMLEPDTLCMAVVALNTAHDAGLFEFFEMTDIYGFHINAAGHPPSPFEALPETTEEACQVREGRGQIKESMIQQRQHQVNERKKNVQIEINQYTVAYQKAWANKFI